MIRINLARQLQPAKSPESTPSGAVPYLVVGLLLLGLGAGSWWLTDSLQARVDDLEEEKQVVAGNLLEIGRQLKGRDGDRAQYEHYLQIAQEIYGAKNTDWPLTLMDEMSRGLEELGIWLNRVEVRGNTVEILGQSLKMNDVGKFLDVLETSQIIGGVPFVEIRDIQEGKKTLYSFHIRFAFNPRARA